MASLFSSSASKGPKMSWEDPMSYPAIKGLAVFDSVKFAHFSNPCGKRDYAWMTNPVYGDAIHPTEFKNISTYNVDEESKVIFIVILHTAYFLQSSKLGSKFE